MMLTKRLEFQLIATMLFVAMFAMGCDSDDDDSKTAAGDTSDTSDTGDTTGDTGDTAGDTTGDTGDTTGDSADTASDTVDTEATGLMPLVLLVDDFEDGDHMSLKIRDEVSTDTEDQGVGKGFWYNYTDVGEDPETAGASSVTQTRDEAGELVMDGEGYESEHSFKLDFSLDKGNYEWDPYVGWGVSVKGSAEKFDASSYGGIAYMYRGPAHNAMIESLNITDYDHYTHPVEAATEWTQAKLEFKNFNTGGWGEEQPLELDNVGNIGWQIKGITGHAGTIEIDNVGFVSKDAFPRVIDLEINEPEVPEKEEIADLTIANELQVLAMNSLNKGVNLTNWLEEKKFEGATVADYKYGEAYVNALAAHGYKALRLPIDLDQYTDGDEPEVDTDMSPDTDTTVDTATTEDTEVVLPEEIVIDPVMFDILDNFEAWTAAAGMSLTIDYHQYDKSMDITDPLYVNAVVKLWTAVAAHFSMNTREDLFYEVANEPEQASGLEQGNILAADYRVFAQQIIDGIRSADTAHAILYGDVYFNSIFALTSMEPFADDRMIYLFHFYEPFIFTHQGAGWVDGLQSAGNLPWPYSTDRWSEYSDDFGFQSTTPEWQFQQLRNYHTRGNRNWLYNKVAKAKIWAIENNVPVIVNEFGAYERKAQKQDLVNYYTDLVSVFEELQIPWQSWFTLVDPADETLSLDPEFKTAFGL